MSVSLSQCTESSEEEENEHEERKKNLPSHRANIH